MAGARVLLAVAPRVLSCGCLLGWLLVACGDTKPGVRRPSPESMGGAAGARSDGGAGGTTAVAGSGVGAGGDLILDAGIDDEFDVCEAEESSATPPGLDIYMLLDHSGSMAQDPEGQNADGVPDGSSLGDCPIDLEGSPVIDSRWCLATNALSKFFTSPSDRDLRVALQFMTPAENFDVCGPVADNPHATPLVGLSRLPVDAGHALVQVLEDDFPRLGTTEGVTAFEFGTRIEGALNGIVRFTEQNRESARTTIGVLITDGDPNQCQDDDLQALGSIAGDHYQATGIPIFIIGMTGATAESLEIVARDGGAPEHEDFCDASHDTCHYWSVGDGEPEAFSEAFRTIQQAAVIPCEYTLPEPGGGKSLNPELVQVKYASTGDEPEEIVKVASADSCDGDLSGWFYDDPDNPSRILLCPSTCELVNESTAGGTLSLAYGCRPEIR